MPFIYGPKFRWFAWHPVDTEDRGWRWLRMVWRQAVIRDIDGFPMQRRFFNTVDKDYL